MVRRGDVRRAKLYYLRGRTGKRARIAEKQTFRDTDVASASDLPAEAGAADASVATEAKTAKKAKKAKAAPAQA